MTDFIIETTNLTKDFTGFRAVNGVNLKFERGKIHALIGPNGAGKTTVFNLLTKFLTPTAGVIKYKNADITALSPADIALKGIGRSFQISSVFPNLTALDNIRIALQRARPDCLNFWSSDKRLSELDDEADALLDSVGLTNYRSVRAVELPYGRKRALEVGTTLALEPEVLLLDEPMAGLGSEDIARVIALIRNVAANRTVLMVEHNLSVVAELSHHITVLARGSVLAEGDYATVSKDPAVLEAYMGISDD